MFSQDFKEFVELLIKYKTEYLIVGGYAVGIHGHPRYTGDLDIWLNPTLENAEKVILCVNDYNNRKEVEIEDIIVNFIGYWDLLENKKKSGRHKDLDDIENLS